MDARDAETKTTPRRRSLVVRVDAAGLRSVVTPDSHAPDGIRTAGDDGPVEGRQTWVELHDGGEVVERRLVEPPWAALEEQIADMLVNTPWVRSRDLVPWARRLIRLRERLDDALEEAGQEPRR